MTYILDRDGKPLMPTKRGNMVRHLLKTGKARVVRFEPFTVMILRDVGHHVQEVTLGVDVGARHVGLCASTKTNELYSAQVELRDDVSRLLTARREFRRGRRGRMHNWYRPSRWQNRANASKKHLPPSIRHKADSHIRAIGFVGKLLPVSRIRLEIGKFDSQKLVNSAIQGEEYQKGTLLGWENLKAYAKYRDGYKCRVCGKSKYKDGVRLEVHHVRRRADGGTDTPDNVVTLCEECHKAHHRSEKKLKFRRPPQHKGEAHMNSMKDYLVDGLMRHYGGDAVGVTFGYKTALARRKHSVEKSHVNDAFCIAGNFSAARNDHNRYRLHPIRRHFRSLHHATVESPKSKSAKTLATMSEKMKKFGFRLSQKAPKHVKGFAKYDTVKYKGFVWTITGSTGTNFYLTRHGNMSKTKVGYKYLTRICAANGIWTERLNSNKPTT